MTSAMQLTITIPDNAAPGSVLSIPVKGRAENVKARVPEGMGPGDTLVLTQIAGTDEWVEESVLKQEEQAAANAVFGDEAQAAPSSLVPPGIVLPEEADLEPLVPSGPVAHTVRLETTVGVIDIIVRPDWAPYGARRFLQLAYCRELDGLAFYRSVKGCLAQFGLPARRLWPPLPDDPPTGVPFLLGAVCFAAAGESSRKSTLFICTGDMSHCFGQSAWETPIGAVAEASLDVLDRIESCYGDIAECGGLGPDAGRIHAEGNAYLRSHFPKLTYIEQARCLDWPRPLSPGAGQSDLERPAPAQSAPAPGYAQANGPGGPSLGLPFEGPPGSSATGGVVAAPMGRGSSVPTATVVNGPTRIQPSSGTSTVTINTLPGQATLPASGCSAGKPAMPMGGNVSVPPYNPLGQQSCFQQQANQQVQMLLTKAAAMNPEAAPVTTSSSCQLLPTATGRSGSYVPPPVFTTSASYTPPPVMTSTTGSWVPPPRPLGPLTVGSPSSLPALGPPLGQPLGQPMAHSVGSCASPMPLGHCGGPGGCNPRPFSTGGAAPAGVMPFGGPCPCGGSLPAPSIPSVCGGCGMPPVPGLEGNPWNFRGLQVPQLPMPTLQAPQMPGFGPPPIRPDATHQLGMAPPGPFPGPGFPPGVMPGGSPGVMAGGLAAPSPSRP